MLYQDKGISLCEIILAFFVYNNVHHSDKKHSFLGFQRELHIIIKIISYQTLQ